MTFSGFILPNYTEVYVESFSTNNNHVKFVKNFLYNLKNNNLYDYLKLDSIIQNTEKKYGNIALDDFAVTTLGWIKLIDKPYKFIFYPDISYAYPVALRYERLGYTSVKLECNLIKISNASKYI